MFPFIYTIGFVLLITQFCIKGNVQNNNVVSNISTNSNLYIFVMFQVLALFIDKGHNIYERELPPWKRYKQSSVWDYLRKKTLSWKAELNEWTGELSNAIGLTEPKLFKDNKGWVDPLASFKIENNKHSEKPATIEMGCTCNTTESTAFRSNNVTVHPDITRNNGNISTLITTQQHINVTPQPFRGNFSTLQSTPNYSGSSADENKSTIAISKIQTL